MRSWNYNNEYRCRVVNCSGCNKLHDRISEAVCPVLFCCSSWSEFVTNQSVSELSSWQLTITYTTLITYHLYTVQSCFGSWSILDYSRNFSHFMDLGSSLPHPQNPPKISVQDEINSVPARPSIPGPGNLFSYCPPTCALVRRTAN